MNETAVIVQRVGPHKQPDTSDIEQLAKSAGYNTSEILTQSREEHKEYNIGSGKVRESHISAKEDDADVIVVDNELGPYQMYNYGVYVPNDVEVLDKYKLILDIFESRANNKTSQLQIEMARLRYELPRAEAKAILSNRDEKPGFMGLGEYDRTREESIKNRIKKIREELSKKKNRKKHRRKKRKEEGFDAVAIAGYTNAGKSTLLRRLSEDHTVDENEEIHRDMNLTAESTPDYFTTLDTTTRKMEFQKRDVLLTDTVGFIDDLPEWLIEAFATTFDSIYESDVVLLVADISRDANDIKRRLATCHDIISRNQSSRIITVFNKIDKISEDELNAKKRDLEPLAPNPVCISSEQGENIQNIKTRIDRALPPFEKDTLLLPLRNESMSLVSWVYDNAHVNDCTYTDKNVILKYEARDWVVNRARSKAGNILPKND